MNLFFFLFFGPVSAQKTFNVSLNDYYVRRETNNGHQKLRPITIYTTFMTQAKVLHGKEREKWRDRGRESGVSSSKETEYFLEFLILVCFITRREKVLRKAEAKSGPGMDIKRCRSGELDWKPWQERGDKKRMREKWKHLLPQPELMWCNLTRNQKEEGIFRNYLFFPPRQTWAGKERTSEWNENKKDTWDETILILLILIRSFLHSCHLVRKKFFHSPSHLTLSIWPLSCLYSTWSITSSVLSFHSPLILSPLPTISPFNLSLSRTDRYTNQRRRRKEEE